MSSFKYQFSTITTKTDKFGRNTYSRVMTILDNDGNVVSQQRLGPASSKAALQDEAKVAIAVQNASNDGRFDEGTNVYVRQNYNTELYQILPDGSKKRVDTGAGRAPGPQPSATQAQATPTRAIPNKSTGVMILETSVEEKQQLSDTNSQKLLKYDPAGDSLSLRIGVKDESDPDDFLNRSRFWAAWYKVTAVGSGSTLFEDVVSITNPTTVSFPIQNAPFSCVINGGLIYWDEEADRDTAIARSSRSNGRRNTNDNWDFKLRLVNPTDRFTVDSSTDQRIRFRVPRDDEFELWIDNQFLQSYRLEAGSELLTMPLEGLQYFDRYSPSLVKFRRVKDNLPDDEWSAYFAVEWNQTAITNVTRVDSTYTLPDDPVEPEDTPPPNPDTTPTFTSITVENPDGTTTTTEVQNPPSPEQVLASLTVDTLEPNKNFPDGKLEKFGPTGIRYTPPYHVHHEPGFVAAWAGIAASMTELAAVSAELKEYTESIKNDITVFKQLGTTPNLGINTKEVLVNANCSGGGLQPAITIEALQDAGIWEDVLEQLGDPLYMPSGERQSDKD